MELDYVREDWNTQDHRWLGSAHGTDATKGVMLDISDAKFVPATHYPDGYLLAGIYLIETATAGFWRPVDPATDTSPGANTIFPLYNGGIKVVDAATDPDPSVAILVHGQIRQQFLPAPYSTETAAVVAALGTQLTLTVNY